MLIIIFSTLISISIFIILIFFFSAIGSIIPSFIILIFTFYMLSKKIDSKIKQDLLYSQELLKQKNINESIKILEDIKKKYKWKQIFIESNINGQIGIIKYIYQNDEKARPYLKKSYFKNWIARVMFALIHYKRKQYKEMNEIFKKIIRFNSKESIIWNIWAYCNIHSNNKQLAINILENAKKKINNDIINNNLINIKNDKKMKLKGYGELWYQFKLELPIEIKDRIQNNSNKKSKRKKK